MKTQQQQQHQQEAVYNISRFQLLAGIPNSHKNRQIRGMSSNSESMLVRDRGYPVRVTCVSLLLMVPLPTWDSGSVYKIAK